jgi:hypothetical protein
MRKFLQFILPKKWYQKIVTESKSWFLVHEVCGYSISVWEAGGVRYGAISSKKKVVGRCPQCDKSVLLDLVKKE